nr:transposase [Deltaproteobacteria bacterium]
MQERRDGYHHGVKVTHATQEKALTAIKNDPECPDYAGIHTHLLQDVVKRLDRAFEGFFRRLKSGQTPGYPRFKSRDRYTTFTFKDAGRGNGAAIVAGGARVRLHGIGNVKMKQHREMEGALTTIGVTLDGDGHWYALITREVPAKPLPATGRSVGIDVGLTTFAALSNGELVANPRPLKTARIAVERALRKVSRRKRGSPRAAPPGGRWGSNDGRRQRGAAAHRPRAGPRGVGWAAESDRAPEASEGALGAERASVGWRRSTARPASLAPLPAEEHPGQAARLSRASSPARLWWCGGVDALPRRAVARGPSPDPPSGRLAPFKAARRRRAADSCSPRSGIRRGLPACAAPRMNPTAPSGRPRALPRLRARPPKRIVRRSSEPSSTATWASARTTARRARRRRRGPLADCPEGTGRSHSSSARTSRGLDPTS